jgi:hypothetical protein
MTIDLYDENLQPLQCRDNNMLFTLLITSE